MHLTIRAGPGSESACSWRDLILTAGGVFLCVKGTRGIPPDAHADATAAGARGIAIAQINALEAAGPAARFVNNIPSVVMLALTFLLMFGTVLIAGGFGHHVPKGYIYSAMAFAVAVWVLNVLARRRRSRRTA